MEPLFKNLYANKYEKEEFLLDADMEFFKVKKLLDKNPNVLKDDPLISIDYMKIISLLKRKKLFEDTSDQFDPENSYNAVWSNLSDLKRDELMKQRQSIMKYSKESVTAEVSMNMADAADESRESNVKKAKKKELQEQRQIIQQFDKLAGKFEKGNQAGDTAQVVSKQTGKLVSETAGMLK